MHCVRKSARTTGTHAGNHIPTGHRLRVFELRASISVDRKSTTSDVAARRADAKRRRRHRRV